MISKCPICKRDISCDRNTVFLCSHASMPYGVVFTTERNAYEWNCSASTDSVRNKGFNKPNLRIHEKFKDFEKKNLIPIIFE